MLTISTVLMSCFTTGSHLDSAEGRVCSPPPLCQAWGWAAHSVFPLRKCPHFWPEFGQCGQGLNGPHITKVPWCQCNHIVCTVTTSKTAILLCQFFPIYGLLCEKMNDGDALDGLSWTFSKARKDVIGSSCPPISHHHWHHDQSCTSLSILPDFSRPQITLKVHRDSIQIILRTRWN